MKHLIWSTVCELTKNTSVEFAFMMTQLVYYNKCNEESCKNKKQEEEENTRDRGEEFPRNEKR